MHIPDYFLKCAYVNPKGILHYKPLNKRYKQLNFNQLLKIILVNIPTLHLENAFFLPIFPHTGASAFQNWKLKMPLNFVKPALFLGLLSLSLPTYAKDVDSTVLPEDFSVYVQNDVVINYPARGFERKILPTRNLFLGSPGGYIACYSHHQPSSVYGVGGGIYVMGQLRIPGHYHGRLFHPNGYINKDISAASKFKALCTTTFPACRGECWAGGDTGGWFGM